MVKDAERAAKLINIELIAVSAKGPDEFDLAFAEIAKTKADGAIVLGDAMFRVNARLISALEQTAGCQLFLPHGTTWTREV
jgi:hypothetical protein